MAYRPEDMQDNFTFSKPESYTGTYAYGNGLKWAKRNEHDPWTWWHQTQGEKYPHVTVWANDFKGGELVFFHVTYNYQGLSHKPVHVYYYRKNQAAVRRYNNNPDFARAGSDPAVATDYNDNWAANIDALAQTFLDKVFS